MLRTLLSFLRPLPELVREIRILRELYEADLASRNPPVYRVTERPSSKNTEVSYAGESDDRPIYKRWMGLADEDEEAFDGE